MTSIHTDILIIGGGIVGASIAYHLAREGKHEVLLLERHQLTSGTTWHAAGLVAELRASANLTRLARYSGELYEQLEQEGYNTGYKRVGAITLATSEARKAELQRQAAMARNNGVACSWLENGELAERWPHLNLQGVAGAAHMPGDGQTNPVDTTMALAAAARAHGAVIREGCAVDRLLTKAGKVIGAATQSGDVFAEQTVIASGLWSRELAMTAGANIPVHAAEHFYAVTEPMDIPGPPLIVRDPDLGVYIKPDAGRLLVGCFEREAKPLDARTLPADFSFDELPFDLEHFAPYLENAMTRIPALAEAGIRTWFNGPEGFTPDGRYLLGPTPEVKGLYVACGFNSIGIQSAGGVGRVMADWISQAAPPMDLWDVDIRRFSSFHNQGDYLRERTAESLGLLYAMHWPYHQHTSARGQRLSALHAQMAAAGACFGEVNGWERPNWFARAGQTARYEYSWGAQNWFDNARAEHLAVRRNVALFDLSSFAKYDIDGPDAVQFLNRLCTANIDRPVGSMIYCQWLNERGGIEADVTVTRLEDEHFRVVSGCASEHRDLHWLKHHAEGCDVNVRNVTERYSVLGLMGPEAWKHLSQVSSFTPTPFSTSQIIEIAGKPVRASRISYVGSLGWELYIEAADASEVYQALTAHGVQHAGYHAMDGLRIEKGYRHWGHDLTDENTPLEAGVSFTCDWQKPGGFTGRAALEAQRTRGIQRRLVSFRLTDDQAHMFHDEPIWRDGRPVGHITSAAYGHTIGACIGLGYVNGDFSSTRKETLTGRYQIEIGDQLIAAVPSLKAWHDPQNAELHQLG